MVANKKLISGLSLAIGDSDNCPSFRPEHVFCCVLHFATSATFLQNMCAAQQIPAATRWDKVSPSSCSFALGVAAADSQQAHGGRVEATTVLASVIWQHQLKGVQIPQDPSPEVQNLN